MVNNSPKSSGGKVINIPGGNLIDALEDDLVSKYENQYKEKKEQQKKTDDAQTIQKQETYMIFERHFEDEKDS